MKENISGRYSIITNQNRGFIDIIQRKDGTVKGKMFWYMTKGMENEPRKALTEDTFEGTVKEIVEYKGRTTIEINFTRDANPDLNNRQSKSNPQRYTGWFSEDQDMISGFYENDKEPKDQKNSDVKIAYRMPWYADRHVFSEKKNKKN